MAIRVLICDDSAVMRALLADIIGRQPGMQVVGTAADPLVAREMIRALDPDVLTLDVEMPRMDGLDFLRRLMHLRPMPVVMISNFTERGSEATFRAMELGAVEILSKPRAQTPQALAEYAQEVGERIRAAYEARARTRDGLLAGEDRAASARSSAEPVRAAALSRGNGRRCVFIGASTGGTEAIKTILTALPASMPPVLMVQHMPEMFTASFARRLDGLSELHVKEAEDGEAVSGGTVYLAPGHSHLSIRRDGTGYRCVLSRSDPVNRHRPSVDVLFNSAAELVGAAGLGVLLTGMGKDGALGLLAMRKAGAWTIAQDQESCVVYGMPREAVSIGAAREVVSLRDIPGQILRRLGSAPGASE